MMKDKLVTAQVVIFILMVGCCSPESRLINEPIGDFYPVLWRNDTLGAKGYRLSAVVQKKFPEKYLIGKDVKYVNSILGPPDDDYLDENECLQYFYSLEGKGDMIISANGRRDTWGSLLIIDFNHDGVVVDMGIMWI